MGAVDLIWNILNMLGKVLLYGWPLLLLVWIIVMKLLWKRWPIEAVIIEKRGSNLIKTNDRAGRYKDPYTGIIGYRLQKAKDKIPVINYDQALHNVSKPTVLFERIVNLIRGNIGTIFLFRYGSQQYKPVKIIVGGKSKIVYQEIKDKEGKPVFINVYQPFDPRDKMGALDFEVVDWDNMNFMVQEQRASMERRKKKGEWMKQLLVPIAMMACTAIVCIIMFKFSFDYAMAMKGGAGGQPASEPAELPDIPIIKDIMPQT